MMWGLAAPDYGRDRPRATILRCSDMWLNIQASANRVSGTKLGIHERITEQAYTSRRLNGGQRIRYC